MRVTKPNPSLERVEARELASDRLVPFGSRPLLQRALASAVRVRRSLYSDRSRDRPEAAPLLAESKDPPVEVTLPETRPLVTF